MGIYTRNGDLGMTTNINGEPISKASYLLEVQGGVDEINSHIGHLRSLLGKYAQQKREVEVLDHMLKEIQMILFKMGTTITSEFAIPFVEDKHVEILEENIDLMTKRTGELSCFLLLSGHETATYAHVIRSTIRRVERDFVRLLNEKDLKEVPADYRFINRLADYFYQVARYLNALFHNDEERV